MSSILIKTTHLFSHQYLSKISLPAYPQEQLLSYSISSKYMAQIRLAFAVLLIALLLLFESVGSHSLHHLHETEEKKSAPQDTHRKFGVSIKKSVRVVPRTRPTSTSTSSACRSHLGLSQSLISVLCFCLLNLLVALF